MEIVQRMNSIHNNLACRCHTVKTKVVGENSTLTWKPCGNRVMMNDEIAHLRYELDGRDRTIWILLDCAERIVYETGCANDDARMLCEEADVETPKPVTVCDVVLDPPRYAVGVHDGLDYLRQDKALEKLSNAKPMSSCEITAKVHELWDGWKDVYQDDSDGDVPIEHYHAFHEVACTRSDWANCYLTFHRYMLIELGVETDDTEKVEDEAAKCEREASSHITNQGDEMENLCAGDGGFMKAPINATGK